jgi:hypothetical protein
VGEKKRRGDTMQYKRTLVHNIPGSRMKTIHFELITFSIKASCKLIEGRGGRERDREGGGGGKGRRWRVENYIPGVIMNREGGGEKPL